MLPNAHRGTVGGQIGYLLAGVELVFGVEGQGNWSYFSGRNTSSFLRRL